MRKLSSLIMLTLFSACSLISGADLDWDFRIIAQEVYIDTLLAKGDSLTVTLGGSDISLHGFMVGIDCAETSAGGIVKCCGSVSDQAATFRSVFSLSVSCIPSLNCSPANTRGRSSGALSFRQRCCAISNSLNAIVSPLLREPAPLVTRCRNRTVAKADSITFVERICFQCSAGKSKWLYRCSCATSGGVQIYRKQLETILASGRNFPVAALETIAAGAIKTADETHRWMLHS